MDKKRFDKLTEHLIDYAYRNEQSRKKYQRAKERGKDTCEPRDDSLTTVAKPRPRPCEDCDLITVNNFKVVYRQEDPNGVLRWYKKCDECGKKFLFHGKSKKSTK